MDINEREIMATIRAEVGALKTLAEETNKNVSEILTRRIPAIDTEVALLKVVTSTNTKDIADVRAEVGGLKKDNTLITLGKLDRNGQIAIAVITAVASIIACGGGIVITIITVAMGQP